MKNSIILFLCILLHFSCSKEEEPIKETLACIGSVQTNNILPRPGCEDFTFSDSIICDVINVGTFTLEASSKMFMPQYCQNIGDQITFINESGGEINFEIKSKSYNRTAATYSTSFGCEDDSIGIGSIGLCVDSESISIQLDAIEKNLDFTISISTIPDITVPEVGKVGDQLLISRSDESGFTFDFRAIINQRTLAYDRTSNQEFDQTLEVNGQTFSDVISKDISSFITPTFKYFYNAEIGLLGFVDKEGVSWRIK